jgi:hypothetical protein
VKEGAAAWLAEFGSAPDALAALRALRGRGFRALDLYAPYEVAGAAEALGDPRPRGVTRAALILGALGAASGYAVQWFTAVDYPLIVGGRPVHSAPAFVPITFELGILLAAFGALLALLRGCRLPRLWQPIFEVEGFERATLDRFFIGVAASDPCFDAEHTPELLEELGALRVQPVPTP